MANKFYDKGIEAYLEGGIASLSDTLKANLLSSASYTPNYSTDQYLNIIAGGAIIAAGVALSSKSGAAGTLSAANVVWTSVSGGAAAYIGLYKDTGTSSTSPLILLIDTASGLPVTPNGGDITVAWSSGQVFTLCEMLPEAEREWSKIRKLIEWLRDACGIPAVIGAGRNPGGRGVWIPEPRVTLASMLEPSRLPMWV